MVQDYQYGTSPRKIESDYNTRTKSATKKRQLKVVEDVPRQQVKVSKEQRKIQLKMTFTVAGIFLLLLTISCRNSQIDKQFTQIQEQKKQLAALQKENEQLKVSIENSLNLNNVEKVAKEELGMQKLTSKQTVYVTLPKKDYVESASEKVVIEEEKSWWEELTDKILNF
ncbi:MAG: cell division protein FtsL [Clostridia bacterium]|nr:cell division protein FtsL [Clostridia bacterium]